MIPKMPDPPKQIDVWWVLPGAPVSQLTTSDGEELACLWGALYGMRADQGATKFALDDGKTLTVLRIEQEAFVVQEPSMRTFMRVIRANGIHGMYRKAGMERTYEF